MISASSARKVAQSDGLPLVSVGLPTFNRSRSLRRAIESVRTQDYPNLELVISDNASTDDSNALCEQYTALDRRIRYHRQPVNAGAHANFLAVLREARGRYFMWLGDDDSLSASYISRCASVLLNQPDVSLACGTARYLDGTVVAFEGVRMNLTGDSPRDRVLEFYRHVSDNGTFYGLMHRELLLKLPSSTWIGSDWSLIAAVAFKGKIVTLDDIVVSRARDGVSSDLRSLALKSGVPAHLSHRPYEAIAGHVLKDIVWQSPVFAELGVVTRLSIAVSVLRIFVNRFLKHEHPVLIWWNRLRFRLKLRTRVRRALGIG
jgi:glycosyltransferase involved in cell wall biosynthesis